MVFNIRGVFFENDGIRDHLYSLIPCNCALFHSWFWQQLQFSHVKFGTHLDNAVKLCNYSLFPNLVLLQLSESLEWDSERNKWRTTEIQNNTKYYSTVKCFPPTHRRHVVVFIRLCNFVWYFHFCSCFQINCFKRIKFLMKIKTTWWKKVTNSIDIAETSNARDDYIICSHRCVTSCKRLLRNTNFLR